MHSSKERHVRKWFAWSFRKAEDLLTHSLTHLFFDVYLMPNLICINQELLYKIFSPALLDFAAYNLFNQIAIIWRPQSKRQPIGFAISHIPFFWSLTIAWKLYFIRLLKFLKNECSQILHSKPICFRWNSPMGKIHFSIGFNLVNVCSSCLIRASTKLKWKFISFCNQAVSRVVFT